MMTPEQLVDRLKRWGWSHEIVDVFGEAAPLVKSAGGKENTQLATIYAQAHAVGMVTLSQVEMECGPDVHKLVKTVNGEDGWSRDTREPYQVGVAAEKCQGAAIVLMAPMIVKMLKICSKKDDQEGLKKFLGYQGLHFWSHTGQMVAAWQGNKRVQEASEFPELRTDRVLSYLAQLSGALYKDLGHISTRSLNRLCDVLCVLEDDGFKSYSSMTLNVLTAADGTKVALEHLDDGRANCYPPECWTEEYKNRPKPQVLDYQGALEFARKHLKKKE